jgi:hypothetical protein
MLCCLSVILFLQRFIVKVSCTSEPSCILTCLPYASSACPSWFADFEAGIDWWLAAFLPAGALTPKQLQSVVQRAYDAAEQQGGSSALAQGIMAAVPEAEAEVIRAELDKIKLSGGLTGWL